MNQPDSTPLLQVCVGNYTGGRDTCQGDSGGPILSALSGFGGGAADDGWEAGVQIAITSYGDGCAQPGQLSVYTRVAAYAQWIQGQVPGIATLSSGASVLRWPSVLLRFPALEWLRVFCGRCVAALPAIARWRRCMQLLADPPTPAHTRPHPPARPVPLTTTTKPAPAPPAGVTQPFLPAAGSLACGQAWSNTSRVSPTVQPALVDCGAFAIASINFAYYGNPQGSCWAATRGSCDGNVVAAVAAACVGRAYCSVVREHICAVFLLRIGALDMAAPSSEL